MEENKMTNQNGLYTGQNLKGFFHTDTAGLPSGVVPFVETFNKSYAPIAAGLGELMSTQPDLAAVIIPVQISGYKAAVGALISGWNKSGNA